MSGFVIWMFPKIGGKTPKWMVYNNGKPYEQMDDLGVKTPIFGSTPIFHVKQNTTGWL